MKTALAVAMAALLGFSGLVATSSDADARKGFRGGGGGGFSGARMGGMRSFSGPRMSSRGFSGRSFGPRVGRSFSGPRVAGFNRGARFGNYNRGPRAGNFNRSGRKWTNNGGWKGGRRGNRRYYGYGFGIPFAAAAGYYGYNSYYGSGDDCGWLRRRAIDTGSSYWWSRYDECRYGY